MAAFTASLPNQIISLIAVGVIDFCFQGSTHTDTAVCSSWGRACVLRAAKAKLSALKSPAGNAADDSLMDSLPLNAKGKITHGIITYECNAGFFFFLSIGERESETYVDLSQQSESPSSWPCLCGGQI